LLKAEAAETKSVARRRRKAINEFFIALINTLFFEKFPPELKFSVSEYRALLSTTRTEEFSFRAWRELGMTYEQLQISPSNPRSESSPL
jgi:hypothetical protein